MYIPSWLGLAPAWLSQFNFQWSLYFVKYFWIFFNSDSKKEEGLLWGLCSGKRMMFSQFKYSHVHMCDYAYLKIV